MKLYRVALLVLLAGCAVLGEKERRGFAPAPAPATAPERRAAPVPVARPQSVPVSLRISEESEPLPAPVVERSAPSSVAPAVQRPRPQTLGYDHQEQRERQSAMCFERGGKVRYASCQVGIPSRRAQARPRCKRHERCSCR